MRNLSESILAAASRSLRAIVAGSLLCLAKSRFAFVIATSGRESLTWISLTLSMYFVTASCRFVAALLPPQAVAVSAITAASATAATRTT